MVAGGYTNMKIVSKSLACYSIRSVVVVSMVDAFHCTGDNADALALVSLDGTILGWMWWFHSWSHWSIGPLFVGTRWSGCDVL